MGLCWEFPKLTCYGNYFLKMWHVSQFEAHFASLNADVVKLTRVEGSPLATANLKVAKILAQTDVRFRYHTNIILNRLPVIFTRLYDYFYHDVHV